MLTQEKGDALAEFLAKDEERAKKLAAMPAEDAAKEINAEGFDLTAEDLAEFAEALAASQKQANGELDEASLEGVSGGYVGIYRPIYNPLVPIVIGIGTWLYNRRK